MTVLGNIVTLGIEPNFACTGYFYIRCGANIVAGFDVNEFVEKPSRCIDQDGLKKANYLWNSGVFIVR